MGPDGLDSEINCKVANVASRAQLCMQDYKEVMNAIEQKNWDKFKDLIDHCLISSTRFNDELIDLSMMLKGE